MDEKVKALIEYLYKEEDTHLAEDDIKVSDWNDSLFLTPCGSFSVFTEDEANKAHNEYIRDFIDDLGVEGFSGSAQEYILDHFVELDNGEEFMEEDYRAYYEDIESEASSNPEIFTDRLQEELFEKSFGDWHDKDLNDSDIRDWFADYDERKDDLIEEVVEKAVKQWDSPTQYVLENFGRDYLKQGVKEGFVTFDYDGISKYVMEEDGRGNCLSSWDGQEIESGDFFIYKQDEEIYDKNFEYEADTYDEER
jgi:hypothetical protein